ncbi:MAG: DUF2285 domain-containing protein [Gammaproteobacteria bacterium]
MPDWRDPDDYPRPDDLDDPGWRWEFLRRTPEYRQDWEANWPATFEAKPDIPPDHIRFRAKMPGAVAKYALPYGLPNPAFSAQQLQPSGLLFTRHLDEEPPPDSPELAELYESCEQEDVATEHAEGELSDELIVFPNNKVQCRALFDLDKPLKPQLATVEEQLKVLQKQRQGKLRRNRSQVPREEWPTLLRVLDAISTGATYKDIGQLLYGVEDYDAAGAKGKKKHDQALKFWATL